MRLLRERDDCPVVVSANGAFPAPWEGWGGTAIGEHAGTEGTGAWETLPLEEQWRHGLCKLYARVDDKLEICPDWSTYRFGHRLSVLDLLAEDLDTRLDRAFHLIQPDDPAILQLAGPGCHSDHAGR